MENLKKSLTILDSWSSISEKTIFVLDRSDYFTGVSSGHSIEGDFLKDVKKQPGQASDKTIELFDRTLWTCAVEAVVGYSRLVWDLFTPDQKSISIIAGGLRESAFNITNDKTFASEKLCSWISDEQNLDHLLKSLARSSHLHQKAPGQGWIVTKDISSMSICSPESRPIIVSLEQALDELAHLTKAQLESRSFRKNQSSISANTKQQTNASPGFIDNNGRVILISSFQDEQAIVGIIEKFELNLRRKNESIASLDNSSISPSLSPINYCDLVIINSYPLMDEGPCSRIGSFSAFKPNLHVKVFSVKSGRYIGGLLNNLCLQHHNLKSTTITGIPMKEEQSASSSSQYDVEIVHCSSIHQDIINSQSLSLDDIVEQIDRNGFPCDTFKLQWYTPRVSNVDLYHCLATSRITAVDINSRPSACLTNFLLSGRQVLLEIFKSKSNRMTTHVLASHNGELYIHSLATNQSKHNIGDFPSIGDHMGGKVGDYRMNDFVSFIKQHTLCKPAIAIEDPLNRSTSLIKRQTLYWPLVLGHTILLNIPNFVGGLLARIPKESMSHADVEECKRCIDNLIKSEKDGHALPSITLAEIVRTINASKSANSDVSKLNHLYKLLWNELEYYLRIHSTTTEHEVVLDHLLELRGCSGSEKSLERGTKRPASKSAVMITSSPAKKAKPSGQLLPEISDTAASAASQQQTAVFYKTGFSLYQTWSLLYQHYHQGRSKLPFVGRANKQAILYQQQQPVPELPATNVE